MANLSTHMINKYYTEYKNRDIAFNKSIIRVTGLETKKIFLKILGEQWACVLYSCSLMSAKIIIQLDTRAFEMLKRAKNFSNLRFSFLLPENKNSIVFFVPSQVKGYKNFMDNNRNTYLMTLDFTHRPPDDLIEILGNILHEKEEFEKRKDIRIALEGKIITDIGMASNRSVAIIDNIKRPCIIKNISVSGAMVILSCVPKFVMNKKMLLYFIISQSQIPVVMEGTILRYESVKGRQDIYGLGLEYDKEKIPVEYQRLINGYLNKLETMAKQK